MGSVTGVLWRFMYPNEALTVPLPRLHGLMDVGKSIPGAGVISGVGWMEGVCVTSCVGLAGGGAIRV